MKEESKTNFKSIFQKHKLFWCGFLLTAMTYLIMFAVKGFYPLGDYFLVSGDSIAQYIPFVQEWKQKLLSGDSLSYSYAGAGGMNFYSIYAYYLSNPLNFFWLLFDSATAYKLLNILFVGKAMCAYTTMYLFLYRRPTSARKGCEVVFAYAYAVSNMILALSSFCVYVDCFMLLPLLMLGLEKFVTCNEKGLFVVSLIAMMMANYYIGFMSCIFVALYYLTLSFESFGACFKKGLQIVGISILSLLATSYIWIPVIHDVNNKLYTSDSFQGAGFFENWIFVLNQMFFYESPTYAGHGIDQLWEANIYVGIFTLLLVVSYFFNNKIEFSERMRVLVLFLLLGVSVNEKLLNYVFHLCHYTRGFSNRQCIFFLFLALLLASEQFGYLIELEKEYMKRYRTVHIISAIVLVALVFVCLNSSSMETPLAPYIHTFDFIVVYTILLCLGRKKEEQTRFAVILSVLFIAEAGVNAVHGAHVFEECKVSEYVEVAEQTDLDLSGNQQDSFWRVNKAGLNQYSNLGYLLGYSGMESFSSSLSKDYVATMSKLGSTVGVGVVYDVSLDPFVSSLLGVKKIISGEDTIQGRKPSLVQYKKLNQGVIDVYENPWAVTPIVVSKTDCSKYNELTRKYANEIVLHYGEIKNALCEDITGVGELFTDAKVSIDGVDSVNCAASFVDNHIVLSNMQGSTNDSSILYDINQKSYVTLQCTAKEAGSIYTNLDATDYIGEFSQGDSFTYTVEVNAADFNVLGLFMFDVSFSKWNAQNWQKAYDVLQNQQMKVISRKDDEIVGTLHCDSDSTVFASIVYDDNWDIKVDGKTVKPKEVVDGMLGFSIPAGEHEVKLCYTVKGRLLGAIVSIISVSLLIYLLAFYKRSPKDKKRTDKSDGDEK